MEWDHFYRLQIMTIHITVNKKATSSVQQREESAPTEKQSVFILKKSEECTFVRHSEAVKKDVRKSIEKAFKNEAKQLEQIKIRKEYCTSEII